MMAVKFGEIAHGLLLKQEIDALLTEYQQLVPVPVELAMYVKTRHCD